jgi:hypothetical protein
MDSIRFIQCKQSGLEVLASMGQRGTLSGTRSQRGTLKSGSQLSYGTRVVKDTSTVADTCTPVSKRLSANGHHSTATQQSHKPQDEIDSPVVGVGILYGMSVSFWQVCDLIF